MTLSPHILHAWRVTRQLYQEFIQRCESAVDKNEHSGVQTGRERHIQPNTASLGDVYTYCCGTRSRIRERVKYC